MSAQWTASRADCEGKHRAPTATTLTTIKCSNRPASRHFFAKRGDRRVTVCLFQRKHSKGARASFQPAALLDHIILNQPLHLSVHLRESPVSLTVGGSELRNSTLGLQELQTLPFQMQLEGARERVNRRQSRGVILVRCAFQMGFHFGDALQLI